MMVMRSRGQDYPELSTLKELAARWLFGRSLVECVNKGICVSCGSGKGVFRDDLSWTEYMISGMCQKCQDSVFDKES